jgi:Type II secretion system protein C
MNANTHSRSKRSVFTFAGMLLVAAGLWAGFWYGGEEAGKLATPVPTPTRSSSVAAQPNATSGKVNPTPSSEPSETVLTGPRYARPPLIFDPGVAIAAAAAASAAASAATSTSRPTTQVKSATPAEIVPGGWVGRGTDIERAWESNAQTGWSIRTTPLTPPNWRISGVVQRGSQTQVIVLIDGEPNPKFFKIGDTLPGGAQLAWVQPDVVGVVSNGGNIAVPVLEGQTQAASKAAATASSATAAPNKP